MKTKVLIVAAIASILLGPAYAAELKVSFSIESSNPVVVGTAPYGLSSAAIDLEGSFTTHQSESPLYGGFGFIDSIDFSAGSRTYSVSDIRPALASVFFNADRQIYGFYINLDNALDDNISFGQGGGSLVLNGAEQNSIFCDSCVRITSIDPVSGVSSVPLPASAPMFGAALSLLGAVGYGSKRKKATAGA